MSNRGPWIIASAIIAAALIVVGSLWAMGAAERECERYRQAVDEFVALVRSEFPDAEADNIQAARAVFFKTDGEIITQGGDGELMPRPEGCRDDR